MTRAAGNFHPEELDTPVELFDGYLHDAAASGYYFLSAKVNGRVAGFVCYGPTDLTEATYDLYWIATDASVHGTGVGSALFERMTQEIKRRGGRLLMISTSSTPEYAPARAFYSRLGCKMEARIKNFYREGDDLCIYTFRL